MIAYSGPSIPVVINLHLLLYTCELQLPVLAAPMDVNFRKIDIDQYDEDVLLDNELYDSDPRDPAQALNEVKQNAAAVRSSLYK